MFGSLFSQHIFEHLESLTNAATYQKITQHWELQDISVVSSDMIATNGAADISSRIRSRTHSAMHNVRSSWIVLESPLKTVDVARCSCITGSNLAISSSKSPLEPLFSDYSLCPLNGNSSWARNRTQAIKRRIISLFLSTSTLCFRIASARAAESPISIKSCPIRWSRKNKN